MELQEFGARLKELRKQAGMTQRELADRVNVDFSYLSKIENGAMPPPSEKVILQLAEALSTDKDELITLAGKVPSDIAQLLKNRETLQRLRSAHTRQTARASKERGRTINTIKQLMSYKSLSKIVIPIVVVLAIAASLWYASPTPVRALNISFPSPPSSATLGSTQSFTVKIDIDSDELLPIQSVDMEIYNVSDTSKKATCTNLPLIDGVTKNYSDTDTGGGGTVSVTATAPYWEWFYGYGYAVWQGSGYYFNNVYGYGYQTGAASITYDVTWTSPSAWPAGAYEVEAEITAIDSNSNISTFTKTSDEFTLSTPVTGVTGAWETGAEADVTGESLIETGEADTGEAGEILIETGEADIGEAGDILVDAGEQNPEVAGDILVAAGEQNPEVAGDILVAAGEQNPEVAGDILEAAGVDNPEIAGDILEAAGVDNPEIAGDILEAVATDNPETAGNILEETAVEQASAVMEELSTASLDNTIPTMSETSLTERLPGLTPEKLGDIDKQVLFDSLASMDPEPLNAGAEPPQPPAGAAPSVTVYETESGGSYLSIVTTEGDWVVLAETPAPLEKLLAKTKTALQDVETTVEISSEQPPEVAVGLPTGQIVRAYINISFENMTPEDIELGHMTFYVEKEWIEENSIHKWSVALHRYDPELEKWIALPTTRVEEDDSYVYYTTVITRFSTFAISGSQAAPTLKFNSANLVISPTVVETGQEVIISADITNPSDTAGTFVVTLWIGDTVEAGKDVSLEVGETKLVSFTVSRDVEGSYEVRLDRLFGSFSVTEAAPTPAAFAASDLTISPTEVDIGEPISISAIITNTGDLAGSYEATLKIDNVVVATKDVTLAGGATQKVTFITSKDAAGTYTVNVDGLSDTFVVKSVFNWWLIGGIIAGVIIIGVIIVLVARRRRD